MRVQFRDHQFLQSVKETVDKSRSAWSTDSDTGFMDGRTGTAAIDMSRKKNSSHLTGAAERRTVERMG